MINEIWVDIMGYKGIYAVSDKGNIKSYSRKVRNNKGYMVTKDKILKNQINNKGYKLIMLSFERNREVILVHRLVASAFIDNPNNLSCVNHIDSNPLNNKVDNLEWVTYKENIQHAIKKGRFDKSFEMTNEKFKEDRKSKMRAVVGECVISGKKVYFDSIQEAGRSFNGMAGDICNVCKGNRQTAQGYKWSYID